MKFKKPERIKKGLQIFALSVALIQPCFSDAQGNYSYPTGQSGSNDCFRRERITCSQSWNNTTVQVNTGIFGSIYNWFWGSDDTEDTDSIITYNNQSGSETFAYGCHRGGDMPWCTEIYCDGREGPAFGSATNTCD